MTEIKIENVSLDSNTKLAKVCQKYFVDRVTDISTISRDTGISEGSVRTHLSKFRKMATSLSVSNNASQSLSPANGNKILEIEVKNKDEKLILGVKTCKEFEDFLVKNKQVKTTANLFGRGKPGKYYYLKIVSNYIDDINLPIFRSGMINFAILRVEGISNGITLEVDGLLTEKQIQTAFEKFKTAFKRYYATNVLNENKVDVKLEIYGESKEEKND